MASEWAGVADSYDRSFARLCRGTLPELVSIASPAPGSVRALDVGTWTGSVARGLRDRGWTVDACDRESSMITKARDLSADITFTVAELPVLPYPADVFTFVTANFVLNHVSHPALSVQELARVTTADGVVAVTIWPSDPISDMNRRWSSLIEHAGAIPLTSLRLPANEDFARSEAGLTALPSKNGLGDVRVRTVRWNFRIAPVDLWAAVDGGVATIGATYLAQTPVVRSRMRAAFDDYAQEKTVDGLLHLPSFALLAHGTPTRRAWIGMTA